MSRYATPADLIPQAHCVLGTMLRPYSIGHRLLLAKVDSPFLILSDATPEQLALAVFICGASFSDSQESLVRGEWESDFNRWLQKLRGNFLSRTVFDHSTELEKFLSYLADGNRSVPLWKYEAPRGIAISAPTDCVLLARLAAGGFDHAKVLEMYLPMANYLYHTCCEIEQAGRLTDAAKWRKVFYTADDHARLHPEEFQ